MIPRRVNRGTRFVVREVQPPYGGWNARDELSDMSGEDAVVMENFVPDVGKVSLRQGYSEVSDTGTAADVSTVAGYSAGTTNKLLAASNGTIWDVSAASGASLASGFSVNRWQTTSFNGNLGFVNGTDAPQVFNGSTISAMTVSGSGLTVANLVGINTFHSRTYFWENNSQDFWYSAVNTMGGALTKFPLSRVGAFGGNLVAMGTWNAEGGTNNWGGGNLGFDLAVFVMSSGEAIIYQGDDPGSNWTLVGVFTLGEPIDARGVARVGGDLAIVTKHGYVSVAALVSQGNQSRTSMISDKITKAVRTAIDLYGGQTGWQAIYYSTKNWLIVNVPISATRFDQHVMNVNTGAWCKFLGMAGVSWGAYTGNLYFGSTDGKVYRADTGTTDNGAAITGDLKTAFSYFGNRGTVKRVVALKTKFVGNADLTYGVLPLFDFDASTPTLDTVSLESANSWEEIDEDWESWDTNWESEPTAEFGGWLSGSGQGYAVSSRMHVESSSALEVKSVSYSMLKGTALI